MRVVRFRYRGKVGHFHYPLTVEGYRAIYRGYLADPDLQDARARWPFVAMWDNHEFSWQGWQSIQKAGGPERSGQSFWSIIRSLGVRGSDSRKQR